MAETLYHWNKIADLDDIGGSCDIFGDLEGIWDIIDRKINQSSLIKIAVGRSRKIHQVDLS